MASRAKSLMQTSAASPRPRGHLAFALLLAVVTFLSGCTGKSAGEDGVAEFHTQYNARQDHEIYERFKEEDTGATEQGMLYKLDFMRSTLGDVESSELTDFYQHELFVDEPHVRLTYKTTFDSGTATETFWFHIRKDHAVLINWQVDSPEVSERLKQLNRPR